MNKITIEVGRKKESFGINRVKYFFGSNYISKHNILSKIRQSLLKINNSEYSEEFNTKSYMYFDDRMIDSKKWFYYDISSTYDLKKDIKLGTKSLVLKYFEGQIKDIDYSDTLRTVNILLEQLSEEIITKDLNTNEQELKLDFDFNELNSKTISKMIDFRILKKDLLITEYDLSYEELIILQIELLKKIAFSNSEKNIFVLFDAKCITKRISERISNIKEKNMFIIVSTNHFFDIDMNHIVLFEKTIMDLSNDFYLQEEIINELPYIVSIVEFKMLLLDMMKGKTNDRIKYIKENY